MFLKRILEKMYRPQRDLKFWKLLLVPMRLSEGQSNTQITFPKGNPVYIKKIMISSNVGGAVLLSLFNQSGTRVIKQTPIKLIANGGYLQTSLSELYNKYFNGLDFESLADGNTQIHLESQTALGAGEFIDVCFLTHQLDKEI